MQDILQKSYDEIPYQGDVHASTHPNHLRVLAHFFGVRTKPTKQSRILEIGCASGENLFAIAKDLPQASLVGIEFSREQVQRAKKTIVAKAIKNIDIQQLDILKVTPALGKFDYIIAHGIYSWVPEEVRVKIFQIFSENLNPEGLVYLSYNTLPGWHVRGMLRDLMLLGAEKIADNKLRMEHAKKLLMLLANILPSGPLRETVLPELQIALGMPDWYLAHDYLEAHNTAFAFNEICTRATKYKLAYITDADLVKALPQQISLQARQLIDGFVSDKIQRESLYDYAHFRMLRRSLFCAASQPVLAAPQVNLVQQCQIKTALFKDSIEPGLFRHPNGGAVNCSHGVLASALEYLMANPNRRVTYQELSKQVVVDQAAAQIKELDAALVRLFFADMLSLSLADS